MCKLSQRTLEIVLQVFAVLSAIISVCGIAIWSITCYDVFILSDVRQNVRLFILQKVDEELEEMLDQYMPGPRGHRGVVGINEPADFVPEFEQPIVFLVVGVGTILGHAIQFLLAIWLFIVVRTGSPEGVRVWFIGTLLIIIGTLIGLCIQLSLVTFHSNAVATTCFLIIFYTIGLFFAYKYKPKPKVANEIPMSINPKITDEKSSARKSVEYKPVNSPVVSCCGEISSFLI